MQPQQQQLSTLQQALLNGMLTSQGGLLRPVMPQQLPQQQPTNDAAIVNGNAPQQLTPTEMRILQQVIQPQAANIQQQNPIQTAWDEQQQLPEGQDPNSSVNNVIKDGEVKPEVANEVEPDTGGYQGGPYDDVIGAMMAGATGYGGYKAGEKFWRKDKPNIDSSEAKVGSNNEGSELVGDTQQDEPKAAVKPKNTLRKAVQKTKEAAAPKVNTTVEPKTAYADGTVDKPLPPRKVAPKVEAKPDTVVEKPKAKPKSKLATARTANKVSEVDALAKSLGVNAETAKLIKDKQITLPKEPKARKAEALRIQGLLADAAQSRDKAKQKAAQSKLAEQLKLRNEMNARQKKYGAKVARREKAKAKSDAKAASGVQENKTKLVKRNSKLAKTLKLIKAR